MVGFQDETKISFASMYVHTIAIQKPFILCGVSCVKGGGARGMITNYTKLEVALVSGISGIDGGCRLCSSIFPACPGVSGLIASTGPYDVAAALEPTATPPLPFKADAADSSAIVGSSILFVFSGLFSQLYNRYGPKILSM